jgi:hypothetical protein
MFFLMSAQAAQQVPLCRIQPKAKLIWRRAPLRQVLQVLPNLLLMHVAVRMGMAVHRSRHLSLREQQIAEVLRLFQRGGAGLVTCSLHGTVFGDAATISSRPACMPKGLI